jgi:hypothetical protein
MHCGLTILIAWYNQHRPHMTLGVKTPDEVYFHRFPANRRPRIEPRPAWPRGSPCALPNALIAGKPSARFNVQIERLGGHAHLPIVRLQRAAGRVTRRSEHADPDRSRRRSVLAAYTAAFRAVGLPKN